VRIDHLSGSAGNVLAEPDPDVWRQARILVFSPPRPTLVLGSSQRDDVVDLAAVQSAGVDVVRRRSGGGAVFLAPRRCIWLDVLIPQGDDRWVDDVVISGHWLGEVWAGALADLGVEAEVFRQSLQKTEWGRLVCFGAIGPGEVTVAGRKVVGVSQRRTRLGARFQCLVLERWDPREVVDLLALTAEERSRAAADTADVAAGPRVPLTELESLVLERFASLR